MAARVATLLAGAIEQAVASSGRCVIGFSGGRTPAAMLDRLATMPVPWERVEVVQVDERVTPQGHPDRNWALLTDHLLGPAGIAADHLHPMPVEADDLHAGAGDYAALLQRLCGGPATLDVVHLGLGADGHTASLVPGDPVLQASGTDVAVTAPYQGRQRMTLTLPALNRSRRVIWEVTGADKAEAVRALVAGGDIPAARVERASASLVVTQDAAASLPSP